MPRELRTHIPGAMTYVVLRSANGAPIFRGDAERHEFFRRLPLTLHKTRSRLHAVCLTDNDVRLLIEVSEVPLGRFVQHLCSYYSRWVHQRREESGNLFHQRYGSVTIEDQSLIPIVIRHIHRSAQTAGMSPDLGSYVWSSYRAYFGREPVVWVTTQYGRSPSARSRAKRGRDTTWPPQPEGYIPGDAEFVRWLTLRQRETVKPATLEEIVAATCSRLQIEERALVSAARARYLSLARALVTWHARRAGVATLTEAALRLHRDPSTLFDGCRRYEKLYPDLFGMGLETFVRSAPGSFSERSVRKVPPQGRASGRLVLGPTSRGGHGPAPAIVRSNARQRPAANKTG